MVFVTTWFKAKVDNVTIEDNPIEGLRVKDLGISTAKLADNAVTSQKIADNAIIAPKIADLSVLKKHLNAELNSILIRATVSATGLVQIGSNIDVSTKPCIIECVYYAITELGNINTSRFRVDYIEIRDTSNNTLDRLRPMGRVRGIADNAPTSVFGMLSHANTFMGAGYENKPYFYEYNLNPNTINIFANVSDLAGVQGAIEVIIRKV